MYYYSLPHKSLRYETAQQGASALSSVRSGRRREGVRMGDRQLGTGYEVEVRLVGVGSEVESGLKRVQEIQCRFRENTPPLRPRPGDLGGQPDPDPRKTRWQQRQISARSSGACCLRASQLPQSLPALMTRSRVSSSTHALGIATWLAVGYHLREVYQRVAAAFCQII